MFFRKIPFFFPNMLILTLVVFGISSCQLMVGLVAMGFDSCGNKKHTAESYTPVILAPAPPPKPVQPAWEVVLDQLTVPVKTRLQVEETLVLDLGNAPFSEQDFTDFMSGLGQKILETAPPFLRVAVSAKGENDTVLKGQLALSDMRALLRTEISRPEWIRRLDIQVEETLSSLMQKARAVRAAGSQAQAAHLLERLLVKTPDSLEALSLLGNVYRDLQQYMQAIETYQKILKAQPQSVFAWHNIAFCQEKRGLFSDAAAAYLKSLEIEPQNVLLMTQLAEVYRKNGEPAQTLAWTAKARAIASSAELWIIEGNADRDLKKFKEAQTAYLEALKINPNETRALFNLILIDLDLKNIDEARKKFSELKVKDSDMARELATLGLFSGGK